MHHSSLILLLLLFAQCLSMKAQRNVVYDKNIRSLTVIADEDWQKSPVTTLGDGIIDIDFDEMSHDIHRYSYTVTHCESNWKDSEELFESDYVSGFASGNLIDDITQSILTNNLYTHYHIRLPNNNCSLRLGGNYKLSVIDEEDGNRLVLTACFMVLDEKMGLSMQWTPSTDATVYNRHQQISMTLNYNGTPVTNPQTQLKTVLVQNSRWDDARWNVQPQYNTGKSLAWDHCRDYIFEGGNEYRKFEILSTDAAAMGIERLGWDGKQWHAYPFLQKLQPNYLTDVDADGHFLIRNSDNSNADNESDYMLVHFQFYTGHPYPTPVYINGGLTEDWFSPEYEMHYNDSTKTYEQTVLLKLGYYNYQFLTIGKDGKAHVLPDDGCFYRTENTYEAFIYYRPIGGRTDNLVGYQSIKTE